ncbi:MAG: L-2-hydroxyglutarate oxidase [Labilithrix sp.]|nr:L-2-hydroxyglutarate oxidase [Labilithrix sp.]MCW5810805.1 L-2-hydroxyglutarate oxidase [Labilithrix sp.]
MSELQDVAVVGGGIVGMASACELLATPSRKVVVLEAEATLGEHQTGRNSGVIHSGAYYKPGSLKATLCREGREAMYTFCAERGITHERCGKVIVATRPEEVPALRRIEERARANGLAPVRSSASEVREHEPHVRCVEGLFIEETGIVRYADVLRSMADLVRERGGEVRTGARVTAIHRDGTSFVVTTTAGEVRAKNLLNCAGLQSDRVARLAGAEVDLRIIPFRGEYYDLVPARRGLCKNLIYPVPDPSFPFLGVHLTRAPDGSVEAGPNAVLAFKREGYRFGDVSFDDVVEYLEFSGFWKLVTRHARTGVYEVYRSLSKAAFVRSVQALVPEVRAEDLVVGRAGVRAQAVEPDGSLVDDFRIVAGPAMLHVLNAPSPAATASLAIAKHIVNEADRVFRA